MSNNERLKYLQETESLRKKYGTALNLLLECGVDLILLEMNAPARVPIGDPKAAEMAAQSQFSAWGWEDCRQALFSLLEVKLNDETQGTDNLSPVAAG